ncbi:MAG: hypothetical protein SP1CHLAM54_10800 [Chlamydiia bacterium]|nr:hypothetical protein [Chlamydiia bacterium]MCH9615985.1 hypothetical protein [Chlamydiia bacterium]MCH9629008.1 hypothetical protein [Chlamydiia bacterium]
MATLGIHGTLTAVRTDMHALAGQASSMDSHTLDTAMQELFTRFTASMDEIRENSGEQVHRNQAQKELFQTAWGKAVETLRGKSWTSVPVVGMVVKAIAGEFFCLEPVTQSVVQAGWKKLPEDTTALLLERQAYFAALQGSRASIRAEWAGKVEGA